MTHRERMTTSPVESPKSYHTYTSGPWYFPLFLILYLPSFIGFWILTDYIGDMNEWVIKGIAIAMIILTYPFAQYIARKYTNRPMRIRFDDEQITVDTFSRDLQTLQNSRSCQLRDIQSFEDTVLTDEKFQLKLKNGNIFLIQPSGWRSKDDDFKALLKDFKAHVKKLNPDGSKETISYERSWLSGWVGKTLLSLSVGGIFGSIALFILGWIKADGFELSLIKLPAMMLIFSLLYISQYYRGGDEDDD